MCGWKSKLQKLKPIAGSIVEILTILFGSSYSHAGSEIDLDLDTYMYELARLRYERLRCKNCPKKKQKEKISDGVYLQIDLRKITLTHYMTIQMINQMYF